MAEDKRIDKLCDLWVKWNLREVDSNRAMYEISKLFKKETMKAWRKHVAKEA